MSVFWWQNNRITIKKNPFFKQSENLDKSFWSVGRYIGFNAVFKEVVFIRFSFHFFECSDSTLLTEEM